MNAMVTPPIDTHIHYTAPTNGRQHDLTRDCWCHPQIMSFSTGAPGPRGRPGGHVVNHRGSVRPAVAASLNIGHRIVAPHAHTWPPQLPICPFRKSATRA